MRYLTEDEIIEINYFVIQKYSPAEPVGLVHPKVLNMIVENPKQDVFGKELYPTLIEKSANIYKNLVQKHIFINGNKRTAFLALKSFLSFNGYALKVDTNEAVEFTVKIAEKSLQDKEISNWISNHLHKMK